MAAQEESQADADAVLVVNTGDSLASDPEIARWARASGQTPFGGLKGFDALVLSAADLEVAQSQGLLRALPVSGTVLLSADVIAADTRETFAAPFTLRTVRGHRIALIGITGATSVPAFRSVDAVEAVARSMAQIRGQADIIVLLSNAGLEADRHLAAQIPGLDVIVGGGEPPLEQPERDADTGTLILRTGYAGQSIGLARLVFGVGGQLQHYTWERRLFTITQ